MEKIVFKQTFKGFDRNQVIEYIDLMSKEFKELEKEYEKEKIDLHEETVDLSASLSKKYEELQQTKEIAEKLTVKIKEYKQLTEELKTHIGEKDAIISNQQKEILDFKNINLELKKQNLMLTNGTNAAVNIQSDAQKYIDRAKFKAKKIIQNADIQAASIRKEYEDDIKILQSQTVLFRQYVDDIEKQIESSFSKLKEAVDKVDYNTSKVNNSFNYCTSNDNNFEKYNENKLIINKITTNKLKEEGTKEPKLVKQNIVIKKSKKTTTDSILENIDRMLDL